MKLREKFIQKVNADLNIKIPIETKINYLKPSINQSARGMMMWVFDHPYSFYGSSVGIKELLKQDKLTGSASYSGLSSVPISVTEIL